MGTARKIIATREAHHRLLIYNLDRGAGNRLKLLGTLYQRPIFPAADVADTLGVTPQAANKLLWLPPMVQELSSLLDM